MLDDYCDSGEVDDDLAQKEDVTLVLAIGNLLMTDEGAGIHVLRQLQKQRFDKNQDRVIYLDGGTLSFSLAAHIENADNLIVIDAAELNSAPGTVKTFIGLQMDQQLGSCKLSVHEVGLIDLMDMVKLSGHMPEKRALVGIQPLTIAEWSEFPSEPVKKSIRFAANQVSQLIEEWQTDESN